MSLTFRYTRRRDTVASFARDPLRVAGSDHPPTLAPFGARVPFLPTFCYIRRGSPEAALAFVISANLVRRHLSWDQRRAIAQQILPVQEGLARERQHNANPKGVSAPNGAQRVPPTKATTTTAKLVDVSPRTIERDKIVAREVPALLPLVAAGKVAMGVATP